MSTVFRVMIKMLVLLAIVPASWGARVVPDKIIPYKHVGDVELTLHVFNPPGHTSDDRIPAIVFFFGGGWKQGDPSQFYTKSAYLASKGMVAVCADYRIAKRHQTSPQECVKDGKSAMRWVRSHAGELGVNPDKIAGGGGSAGGHIAAATALLDEFEETDDDTSVSCRPDALVLYNPVFDNGPDGYGHDRVKAYWKEFSPMHHIDSNAPPTVVMLGTEDQFVPVATAEKYKALMEEAGARCDLHVYPGEKHGFFNMSKHDEVMAVTEQFLKSLGFIDGE